MRSGYSGACGPQAPEDLLAGEVRQLDVKQDQVRAVLPGQGQPLGARLGLLGAVALDLEQVAGELQVLLVVLHDQDQLAGHQPAPIPRRISAPASRPCGRLRVKVLPTPTVLSAHNRPPCSSTNFFASASPRPVPSAFASAPPTWRNSSKTRGRSPGAMPI